MIVLDTDTLSLFHAGNERITRRIARVEPRLQLITCDVVSPVVILSPQPLQTESGCGVHYVYHVGLEDTDVT